MEYASSSNDRAPLFSRGRYNFFATTLIAIAHVITLILTSISMSAGWDGVLGALDLWSKDVLSRGFVWQLVTHAFINGPTFWFIWNLFTFFYCGHELERFYGRRAFLRLYALAILVPAITTVMYGLFTPATLTGCLLAHFTVFAVFGFTFPRFVFFFFPVIWIVAANFLILLLQFIAGHAWSWMTALLVTTGFAWLWTQWQRGILTLPTRLTRPPKPKSAPVNTTVDALLDKISQHGIHSLTEKEHAILEKARQDLLRK